ncbi:outer membrane protein assembly factor BamB family protein [Virgibacillus sp. FSP13]
MLFMAMLIIISSLTPSIANAASFGPEEWNQYRMNNDKNAVFDNGSDPLEYHEFETADEVRATPVIAGNKLLIGNHNSGDLFAFDVATGEKLWQSKAPNWIHSEMIYHDGKVFVGFGNRFFQESGIRGTGESGVLALDAETGDTLWKYNTDGEVMPTPAFYNGAVYVVTGDKHLYKLDPNSGELLHKNALNHVVSMSAPNISGDSLYVGSGRPQPYVFLAYNLQTDKIKWQTEFPDVFSGLDDVPPAVSGNTVVTTALEGDSDNPEHFMYAMDIETGEIIWKESLGTGEFVKNNKSGAPMIYQGNIYVGSPITKTFYAYDLKTGEQLWKFKNEIMKAPPVAEDGIVYFSNTKGFVYALDAETGEVLRKKELGGKLAPGGPVIINDTLFVGSQDSNVYAVPLTDIIKEEQSDTSEIASDQDSNTMQYAIIAIVAIVLIGLILILVKRRK